MCKGTGMAMGSVWNVGHSSATPRTMLNAQQQATVNQAAANMAQNSFSRQAAHQYNQALAAQQQIQNLGKVRKPKQFMIEGKPMDLVEFVETLYPEDCPERTYLLLKFKEE
jgi:hypothetical protein